MPRQCAGPVSVRVPVPFSTVGVLLPCVSFGPPGDLTAVTKEGSNREGGEQERREYAPPWGEPEGERSQSEKCLLIVLIVRSHRQVIKQEVCPFFFLNKLWRKRQIA